MIDLLDLDPFVSKLKLDCPLFSSRFFATLPGDDMGIDPQQSPTGFVYLQDDTSEQTQMSHRTYISQRMTSHIVVETVLRRTASRTDLFNTDSVAKIRLYRLEILNALLGWRPDGSKITVLQHVSGRLSKEPKVLKFSDTFITRQLITGQSA